MKFRFSSIIVGLLILVSCSNNRVAKECAQTFQPRTNKVDFVAGDKMKTWQINNCLVNGDPAPIRHLSGCYGDAKVFFVDHRLEVLNEEKLEKTGHWFFNEDSTEIEISLGSDFFIYKLLELSDVKMHYMSVNKSDTIEMVLTNTL